MTVCCFHIMIISVLISVKPADRFKIPNWEVMTDWARWITDDVGSCTNILVVCVEGHISTFEERWLIFMEQHFNPKPAAKILGPVSLKSIYQVFFLGLMHSLQSKGWEASIEPRAGDGYINIRFISRKTRGRAVLIEFKSSEKPEHMERDASKALEQIVDKNY